MNIILLGAPGSGKGTQSIILNKKLGLVKLSTGEIIRENIEKKTKLGLQVKNLVDNGESRDVDVSVPKSKISSSSSDELSRTLQGHCAFPSHSR